MSELSAQIYAALPQSFILHLLCKGATSNVHTNVTMTGDSGLKPAKVPEPGRKHLARLLLLSK